jgi:FtsH-binding integral membrane protein
MSSPFASSYEATPATSAAAERVYLRSVFAWMLLGLALTTGVAVYLDATSNVLDFFDAHPAIYWILFIGQIAMVFALSAAIGRISAQTAALLFCLYAGLTGVVFAVLLEVYTTGSVVGAFAGATGVFGGMAAYGYTTKRDLTGLRPILFGALIGLIVASVAFAFIGGSTLNLIIGWAGVIIFSGLTAYDMQRIKQIGASGLHDENTAQKLAIFGALALYLDFINLVISLLRIFGGSRN